MCGMKPSRTACSHAETEKKHPDAVHSLPSINMVSASSYSKTVTQTQVQATAELNGKVENMELVADLNHQLQQISEHSEECLISFVERTS